MPHPVYNLKYLLQYFGTASGKDMVETSSAIDIHTIAEKMPAVSGFGLENHLGQSARRTDLLVRATHATNEMALCDPLNENSNLHSSLLHHSSWKPIVSLFSEWNNKMSPFHYMVNNVWLEFDTDPLKPASAAPCVFFDLDRYHYYTSDMHVSFIEKTLETIGKPLSDNNRLQLTRGIRKAPSSAKIHYIGVMLSRSSDGLRLCFQGLDQKSIIQYLDKLHWRGDRDFVEHMLYKYTTNADRIVLDLDMNPTIQSKLGIEIYFNSPEKWKPFLDQLTDKGICSGEEKEDLLTFSGEFPIEDEPLRNHLSTYNTKDINYGAKRLNHLKLGCYADDRIEAKAYKYLCYY